MIISIHQPAYLPWLGYFDRIAKSDVFIFLDNVQFEKNSFTNRNRIKTPNGPLWLTVPVKLHGHLDRVIGEIEVDEAQNWKRKHLRSIEQFYHNAPQFPAKFDRVAASYAPRISLLAEFCYQQLLFWLSELKIETRILRATEMIATGQKSDLVLALCKEAGATTYISGPLGKGYLQEEDFSAAGIQVEYQDFRPTEYPQQYGNFIPGLSVLDYWMNAEPTLFAEPK